MRDMRGHEEYLGTGERGQKLGPGGRLRRLVT